MEFWKTKKFREANLEWNKILKESGFVDAEIELNGGVTLKQRATNAYRQASQLERDTRLDYYLHLGYWTHNTKFPNKLEAFIMTRHAEGATIKEIVEEIKTKHRSLNRKTIRFIIRRWQTKWGIRRWNCRQMNLRG